MYFILEAIRKRSQKAMKVRDDYTGYLSVFKSDSSLESYENSMSNHDEVHCRDVFVPPVLISVGQ